MGWLQWLGINRKSKYFPEETVRLKRVSRNDHAPADGARRFEVADSCNSNQARWQRTDNRTINQILAMQLRTIHERTAYEVRNNAIVEGTINTHCRDVVGTQGPQIQIESSSDRWSNQAEQFLKEYMEHSTADETALCDWLHGDIRDWWQTGDMLAQLVTPARVTEGVRLRVHPLDSRGLVYSYYINQAILGVVRDEYRLPLRYYVAEVEDVRGYRRYQPREIPASDMLHDYSKLERDQVRGFPLLTQALDVISELREHDGSVMKAAQRQAMLSVLMTTVDETTPADEDPADFAIVDGGITRIPPGWAAAPMVNTQPGDNHVDYRTERLREVGAPAGMPLMKLQRDASKHNYSSARMDSGDYQRSCELVQGWLWRRRVKPILLMAMQEAMLRGFLRPRSTKRLKIFGRWDKPPHADPVKEAAAAAYRLNARSSSPIRESLAGGYEFEQLCMEWQRANQLLEQYGMPPMLGPVGGQLTDLENWLNDDPDDGEANDA